MSGAHLWKQNLLSLSLNPSCFPISQSVESWNLVKPKEEREIERERERERMAITLASMYSLVLLALTCPLAAFAPETLGSETPHSFTFERFDKNGILDSAIALYGDADLQDSAVRITRSAASGAGKILYRKPVKFLRGNLGFSTYFCFSLSPSGTNNLAFFLDSADSRLFRLSKNVLLVEFASNASDSRIGIRVTRDLSPESCNLSAANLVGSSWGKLHSWVDYDGFAKRIEVRLSRSRALPPASPFISCPVDISSVLLKEALYVGIGLSNDQYSTSTHENSTGSTFIYSWSFLVKHGAPYLMHSEPLDPSSYTMTPQDESRVHPRKSDSRVSLMAWLFGLVTGALIAFMAVVVWNAISFRRPVSVVEYPVHPVEVGYEKVVMVGVKSTKPALT